MVMDNDKGLIEPPSELFPNIMRCIRQEQKTRQLKFRIAVFSICLFGSAAAFFPAIKIVWTEFAESGFISFLSLLFTDAGAVLGAWQSFGLSLLETLPVTSLIVLFSISVMFICSLRFLSRDIKNVFGNWEPACRQAG
jgi:hypothetical protein